MEPAASAPDVADAPVPADARDRSGWGFALACGLLAALAVGLSSRIPAPLPLDLPRLATGPDPFAEPVPYSPEAIAAAKPLIDPRDFFPTAKTSSARVSILPPIVSGRLPAEVVERIARQSAGRYRRCYAEGLRQNPNLQGSLRARLVIGRDGAVSAIGDGGSDLPDGGVVSCVLGALRTTSFPAPEGGIVTVLLPLRFTPG